MRPQKSSFWYKFAALFLILALIAPVLFACGKEKEKTPTTTSTATAIPTSTPTTTLTPAPTATPSKTLTPTATTSGPVKIGAIISWSGPMAMAGTAFGDPIIKLVGQQVKDQGGILGGRDVQVVKFDNRASVAEAAAGVQKLMYDDKVSAIVWGGVSGAEVSAVSTSAEEKGILFVQFGGIENAEQKKFTLSGDISTKELTDAFVNLTNRVFKPKTVAFLAVDLSDFRNRVAAFKEGLEPQGVKTVYEQYVPLGTTDLMPYLTKIKYEKPDVLIMELQTDGCLTLAIQSEELGGWGDIKVITDTSGEYAKARPGAQGWYLIHVWILGKQDPASVKFQGDYQAMFGRAPTAAYMYYYNSLWTAIYAIEAAGTDTDLLKIAQTARFSGKLEWDTPMGHGHWTADSMGYGGLSPIVCRIEDKQLVQVTMPD